MGLTTITISEELWKILNNARINPRETLEDVIWRYINLCEIADKNKKVKHGKP